MIHFGNQIELKDYNIDIKIKPSQFIDNRLYINNLSKFIIQSLSTAISDKSANAIEYILSEVITNAVKYSIKDQDSEIAVKIFKDTDSKKILFDISNHITDSWSIKFVEYLTVLFNRDVHELFRARINNLCANINSNIDNAGIGLYSLFTDYNLDMGYTVQKMTEDRYMVHSNFYLDLETI